VDIFALGGVVKGDCEKIHAILAEIPFHLPTSGGAVFPGLKGPGLTTEGTEDTEEKRRGEMTGVKRQNRHNTMDSKDLRVVSCEFRVSRGDIEATGGDIETTRGDTKRHSNDMTGH